MSPPKAALHPSDRCNYTRRATDDLDMIAIARTTRCLSRQTFTTAHPAITHLKRTVHRAARSHTMSESIPDSLTLNLPEGLGRDELKSFKPFQVRKPIP